MRDKMLIYQLNADGSKSLVGVADQSESIEKYLPKVPEFKPERLDPSIRALQNELNYCLQNRESDPEYFEKCILDLNDGMIVLTNLQGKGRKKALKEALQPTTLKLSGNAIVIPMEEQEEVIPIEMLKAPKLNSWVTGHIEFVMPQIFTNETPIAEKMTAAMKLLEHMCELLQLKRATISASTSDGDLQRKEIGE